ncbi:MAG: tetratricopeptide repeat protein [Lachnospiraceae bacterium]|nr:tetratricopeptide repeat protein [Lachnospiraceae bacterium]
MKCYSCGCNLTEEDFCTNCGADVTLYKKIMAVSNLYYNQGLEKAKVRDLTGAIGCLRQSLKFNKNNVEARNLLGLVYFETGEVVAALSEWVISKNLRPKKNIAGDYIDMVQANANRLDSINQTIKKYNQALVYCKQDSEDLAIIQLKKVLSLNPKFIRAHQLLALLYINNEEWEKAEKELHKCCKIDSNNTQTLRYLKEVEKMLMPDEDVKGKKSRKNETGDVVKYQSGNETIIQPVNVKEPQSHGTFLYLGIGLVIGIAATCFLISPARIQSARASVTEELRTISEQSDAKTATITELQQQIDTLTQDKEKLELDLEGYAGANGTLQTMEYLTNAAQAYIADPTDVENIGGYLDAISSETDVATTSESFQALYNTILSAVGPTLSAQYYDIGNTAYRNGTYEEAITALQKAVNYDETNADALYTLANAYERSGDTENARTTYGLVIERFPNTDRARRSQNALDGLQ